MTEFWESIPTFWKGVLSSIVAALILTMAGLILRIVIPSIQEWITNRRAGVNLIRQQLVSSDSRERYEANQQILFNVLKWIVLSALLWIASDLLLFFIEAFLFITLRTIAIIFLIFGLWWITIYQNLVSIPSDDLSQLLIDRKWRLVFNPPAGSKTITFNQDGTVGEGQNQNEHTWRIVDRTLELIQSNNQTHSKFIFSKRNSTFIHTNDPNTRSIRNQYIIPND